MKATQLSMSMAPPLTSKTQPQPPDMRWLDVTGIAVAIGFTTKVAISIALFDTLQPTADETEDGYDQRLYDALWHAHFHLSLDHGQSATYNFRFPVKHWKTEEISEVSLHLHIEVGHEQAQLGLLDDF